MIPGTLAASRLYPLLPKELADLHWLGMSHHGRESLSVYDFWWRCVQISRQSHFCLVCWGIPRKQYTRSLVLALLALWDLAIILKELKPPLMHCLD